MTATARRPAVDQLNVAVRRAAEVRRSAVNSLRVPVNPYEMCDRRGLSIRFHDTPSLDGMYCKGKGIFLPSVGHRPAGRLRFTCAHELGHHLLGHGTKVDEYVKDPDRAHRRSPDERAADAFARNLLMPKPAVVAAMTRRGASWGAAGPRDVFVAAGELGVGYETLLRQAKSLRLLSPARFESLRRIRPKAIRAGICGEAAGVGLIVADRHWAGGAVELRVGDRLLLEAAEQNLAAPVADEGDRDGMRLLRASTPGEGSIKLDDGALPVRVCRAGYVGLRKHMFKPEAD